MADLLKQMKAISCDIKQDFKKNPTANHVEACDETIYELIWRLVSSYRLGDFMNNLIYALTFPNFVVTPQGARTVWREDGGKVLRRPTARVEDTENNNAIWWYYGPSDPRTQKAIEGINNLHVRWAKQYPGSFADNADYIYTLAFSAILMHRLRLRLGLSGFSEKEKIAAHHFWRDMSHFFFSEGRIPLEGFPEDWDAMIVYCETFENAPRDGTEQGHLIAEAIYDHFAFRYFPPGLRWLGRAMPVALSLPTTLRAHKIQPVNPILKAIIVFVVGWFMWIGETLLPDPKVAFWTEMENLTEAERRDRKAYIQAVDAKYPAFFTKKHANDWVGCPYHDVLRGGNSVKATKEL